MHVHIFRRKSQFGFCIFPHVPNLQNKKETNSWKTSTVICILTHYLSTIWYFWCWKQAHTRYQVGIVTNANDSNYWSALRKTLSQTVAAPTMINSFIKRITILCFRNTVVNFWQANWIRCKFSEINDFGNRISLKRNSLWPEQHLRFVSSSSSS